MAVVVVAAVLACVGGAIACIVFVRMPRQIVMPKRRRAAYWRAHARFVLPSDAGLEFDAFDIRTAEGLRLPAWYMHAAATPVKGTIVYLHGIGGSRVTTIAGAATFARNGYNVLAYDSRGSGESEARFCTYGFREKDDVRRAIDALSLRIGEDVDRVAMLGKSMGGAIALQAAAIEPRIRCVIAEASFINLRSITHDYQCRLLHTSSRLVHRSALRTAERLANFSVDDVSPIEAVRHMRTPVFFIHGESDPLVSARYSQLLYDAAAGPKELWIIKGGGHTNLRSTAGESYDERRFAFLERWLGSEG